MIGPTTKLIQSLEVDDDDIAVNWINEADFAS